MANAQEAVERVSDFLANRISLEVFEDWSASYVQSIYRVGDTDNQNAAHLIRSILNTYEDDPTEDALRQELADAILPFAPPFAENSYGDPRWLPLPESNSTFAINHAAAA